MALKTYFTIRFTAWKQPHQHGKFFSSDGKEITCGIYEKQILSADELTLDEQNILIERFIEMEAKLNRIENNITNLLK